MFGMWIKNGAEFEELPAIRFVWFCQFYCFSSRICHLFEQNPPVPSADQQLPVPVRVHCMMHYYSVPTVAIASASE